MRFIRMFPWITKIVTKKYGNVMLTYTERSEPKKALFKAHMKRRGSGDVNHVVKPDVVKFTPSYQKRT